MLEKRTLQYRGLFDLPALREALEVEQFRVNQVRVALENQVGENLPCRGRVHDSMPAESVREKESRHARRRAQDRMMIRCHFVQTGPRARRIHLGLLDRKSTRLNSSHGYI